MSVKLSIDQAFKILGVLSTFQHLPQFKMVFYVDRIEVGIGSGTLRGVADLYASATNIVSREGETRDLSALRPLIEKVHACLKDGVQFFDTPREIKKTVDSITAAQEGLTALHDNQYAQEQDKQQMIVETLKVLKQTKIFFLEKEQAYSEKLGFKKLEHDDKERLHKLLVQHDQEKRRLSSDLERAKQHIENLELIVVIEDTSSMEHCTNKEITTAICRLTELLVKRTK